MLLLLFNQSAVSGGSTTVATGQTLLDTMEILNQELQLQTGEEDVARALIALNRAQDFLETEAALWPNVFGSSYGSMTTSTSTEVTTFPTGLLRLDRVWIINQTTSRPKRRIWPIKETGEYAGDGQWPLSLFTETSSGEPTHYWTNGTQIFWAPLPASTYTMRWYGLRAASDITATGTFSYPDIVILPLCAFAVQLLKIGVDDNTQEVDALAKMTFEPVIAALARFWRDGSVPLEYTSTHSE